MDRMLQAAERVVKTCMRLKKGQELLIITDDHVMPRRIGDAIAQAAQMEGAKVVIMTVPAGEHMGIEPPAIVSAAAAQAQVLFLSGDRYVPAVGHTNILDEAFRRGLKMYGTIGVTEDEFCRALNPQDLQRVKEDTDRLARLLTEAEEVRLTSPTGSDIRFTVKGRKALSVNPLDGIMVPDYGEAALAPLEDKVNGVLAVDEVDGWGLPLRRPLKVQVEGGRVAKVLDGDPEEMARFKKVLQTDANANAIAEFALGSSYLIPARLSGARYDLGHLGTSHVAVGRNSALGGAVRSSIHVDTLVVQPTVELDGKAVIRNGQPVS